MGTHKFAGFTIIETMLFLGLSGVLIVVLIASSGASINLQRYRDSTETFKLVLQQQYADLLSVQNGRTPNWACGSDAVPANKGANNEDVGQSECMLMGKYVRVENGDIAIYRVIGYGKEPANPTNDIDTLKANYILNVSRADVSESKIEWGAEITHPVSIKGSPNPLPQSPRKLGILIIRSPTSGQIYTFANNDTAVPDKASINPMTFTNMLVGGSTAPGLQGEQFICISSFGFLTNSDRAVYLNSFASGSSAVEIRTNETMTPAVAQC